MKRFKKFFAATIAAVLTVSSAPGLETPISKLLEKSMSVNADDSTPVAPAAPFFAETRHGGFKLNADGTIMDGGVVSLNDNFEYDSATKTLKINSIEFSNSTISEIKTEYVLDTSAVKGLTIEFDGECKITSKPKVDQKPGCLKVADGTTIKCADGATLTLETTTGANPIYSNGNLTFENANIASNGNNITINASGSITFKNTNITSDGTNTPINASDSITIINSSVKASSIKSVKGITAENPIIFNSSETKFESGKTASIELDSACAAEANSSIITIDNRNVHDFGIFYNNDGKLRRGFGSGFDIITYIKNIEIEEADSTPVIKLSNFNFKTTASTAISTSASTTDITFKLEGTNTLSASDNPKSLLCTPLSLVGGNCTIIGTSDKFNPENIDTLSLEGDNCEVFRCEKLNIEKADLIAQSSSSLPVSMVASSVTGKNLVIEGGKVSSDSVNASKAGVPIKLHAGTAPYCVSSNVKIGKSNDKYYGVYLDVNFFIPDYDSDDANKVFGASVNGGNCVTFTNSDDSDANCRAIIKDVAPKDMANPIKITYNSMNRTPVIYDKNGDKADFCMASVLADIFYNTNADWKEKEFAKAMILYGSRAQTYFKTNTDSLASRYLNSGDVSWTSEATAKSGVNSYTDKITDYSEYIGQTLLLNNTAGIKTYTTDAFKGDFNVYDTIGKRDFSLSQNAEEINGITPDYFGYNLEGKFTVNDVNLDTCHLCIYDYVYTVLNGKDYDQELKDLCCEIYNVGMTAKSFTGVEY